MGMRLNGRKFYHHTSSEHYIPSRSTVFRAMFEHDMEEKKNSAVNVEDVESDAMESMLHFIYTGWCCCWSPFQSGYYGPFGPLVLWGPLVPISKQRGLEKY